MSGWNQTCWTEAIAILLLLSRCDNNLRLRQSRVQFEMGDDRHHPWSLWLRLWFRRRVSFFASFVFRSMQWSGTTTGAGGHQTLSAVFASWKHLISRQHLVIAQQVKLVQPVVEARGLIIQAFFAIVAKPFQDGIKHAELKHLRFLVLLSKYDNLRLRLDRVQFEMGDDRHHPLCSLWLRHWFRRRVFIFISFFFQPKQWSGTTTGAGGHQTLSAVWRVWNIWLADNILISHCRWSLCSLLWRHGVWSYNHFAMVVKPCQDGIKHAELKQLRFWFCFLHKTTIFGWDWIGFSLKWVMTGTTRCGASG